MITHMHFLNTFILCGYYTVWGDEGPTSWKLFSTVLHISEELSLSSRGSQLWPFLSRARVLSVITWQFAPVQPVEKFCGGSRDRAHRWAWLSPENNQHLVLIRWCWCAGADVQVLMCRLSSYTRWEWVCDNLPMLKIVSPQVHVQRSLHPLRSSGGGS